MKSLLCAVVFLAACDAATKSASERESCAACHMEAFRGAPGHVGIKPTACGVCHSQDAWQPSILDHPWALTGAHERIGCFQCHNGTPAKFRGTSKECIGCHKPEYERAPNHVADKFPTKCEQCHKTTAWDDRLEGAKPPSPKPQSNKPMPSAKPPVRKPK